MVPGGSGAPRHSLCSSAHCVQVKRKGSHLRGSRTKPEFLVFPLTHNLFSLQGPDSRAEASGQYHTVTFPLSHHVQHPGPCHHPRLQQRAGVSA